MLTALLFGGVCLTFSLAQVAATRDPARAHLLAPYDGQITAKFAESLFSEVQDSKPRGMSARLASLALQQDPTAVRAAATLGLQAQMRGQTERSRKIFAYAQLLSRRHLQTQLWAIEDAVSRGDIRGTLRQYDIALRSSPAADALLYPTLASALAVPDVRKAALRMLIGRPPWGSFFIDYVSSHGTDFTANALMLEQLRRNRIPISDSANATMVNTLAARVSPTAAWKYYTTLHPGSDLRRSRDAYFQSAAIASIFDWSVIGNDSVSAAIQPTEQKGLFDFSVSSGGGGPLVQQTELLPEGRYRLTGHSIGISQPDRSLPYWTLSCSNGQELGRVTVTNSSLMKGVFGGFFTVPANCSLQTLTLVARPSDDVAGVSGQIDYVQLAPQSD